jgi:hypothetical protein
VEERGIGEERGDPEIGIEVLGERHQPRRRRGLREQRGEQAFVRQQRARGR